MRHVILAVIISLLTYAWIITRHNFNQEQLDKRIRDNIAWLIIIAFVIEAIFGITVAVYVDVSPIHATVSTSSEGLYARFSGMLLKCHGEMELWNKLKCD